MKRPRAGSSRTIDATCPLVTKVHNEARRFAQEGYEILLIGHNGHEEVVGTTGEAPEAIRLVDGPGDVADVEVKDPERVVWLSQTTLSVDETMQTVDALRGRFPALQSPPSDDICYATQNRQAAVKVIAPEVELFLVVGSANSSNSVRMVEVAQAAGANAARLVENADGIDVAWLAGVQTVGLSSGASVPEVLVQEVAAWLADHGYTGYAGGQPYRGAADVRVATGAAPRPTNRPALARGPLGPAARRPEHAGVSVNGA